MTITLGTITNGLTGAQASAVISGNDNLLKTGLEIAESKHVRNKHYLDTFAPTSKNVFDYLDPEIVRGKYIAGDGANVGLLLTNTTFSVTGYIPILAGQTLKSNKSSATTAIGVNLYDINRVKLSTTNLVTSITASVDGYARFTINVTAAEDISLALVQIENGGTSTAYVPFARTVSGGGITDGTITPVKLDAKGSAVMGLFGEKAFYTSLTDLIISTSKVPYSSLDISGWGATYNKVGVTFNGIRLPAGITLNPGVADARKWKYVQVCIKNAQADSTFIAKSPLMLIEGLTVLPEIIFPLMLPDLSALITLDDSSFSGSTYFVNIYYYNAALSYAYGGQVNGGISNYVAGTSKYTTTNQVTTWSNYSGNPPLDFETIFMTGLQVKQHLYEIDLLQTQINNINLSLEVPVITLPDKIYAVVGDTIQLFYRGIIKAVNPYKYDIVIICTKGKWYPRYFEYIPVISDVGTTTFRMKVKNSNGLVLADKSISLVTKNAVAQPSTLKKVLTIGDSLTNARIYPIEASRRLTGTGGTPAGKAYGNISFVGRKITSGVGVEGTGGWSWVDFVTVGRKAYTFAVTAPTVAPAIEAIYADSNSKQYTMWWDYSTTSLKMYVNDLVSTPPASGTLTKISGVGDATLTYSAAVQSSANPFWNDGTSALDITTYVTKWLGGGLDIVYILLTWNGQSANKTDFTTFKAYARTLFDLIHTAYPSVKIKLMGVQVPDIKGGTNIDGHPDENTYTDTYGLTVTALNMNAAYQDLANEAAYVGFVEFVNVSSQFDTEYNMPQTTKAVNTRNAATEIIGTNDVHPDTTGYYQIADVIYRNFISNFCQ